jgi:PmbA protein
VGKYDVLFSPLAYANIIERAADASSIFGVEAGMSFLADKLGKKLGNLTIHDDPTLIDGFRSRPFDMEGFPAKRTTWLDKGVLKTYLHNTSSSSRLKVPNTGHAGLIAPSPTNTVVEPGKLSDEKLLAGFSGLYVTNLWYTRFQNYGTGDFSTIPRDAVYMVKNGELKHLVTDTRISDNMLRMLTATRELSKDSRQIKGWEVEMPVFTSRAIVEDVKITRSN